MSSIFSLSSIKHALFLSVFFLFMIGQCFAVTCHHCYDNTGPNGHLPANCPFIVGVATNVAALAAGSAIVIGQLLPAYLVNYFGAKVLNMLVSLSSLPTVSGCFDFTGKTIKEKIKALYDGTCQSEEATQHAAELLCGGVAADEKQGKCLLEIIAALKTNGSVFTREAGCGPLRYIFTSLTTFVVKDGGGKFTLPSADADSGSTSASKSVTIVHPRSAADFHCILNLFVMTGHATGMFNVLSFLPFLHQFILKPMVSERYTWMYAYELLMVSFTVIEESVSGKSFKDIVEGPMDSYHRTAETQGIADFGKGFFRTHGGIPEEKPKGEAVKLAKVWNNKTTPDSKYNCKAFNENREHNADELRADGTCRAAHTCNKFISSGGPWGRCGGDHKSAKCTHPDKCDTPIKP